MNDTFRFLTQRDRELLLERAQTVRFGPDETIVSEGSRRQALFVVRSGVVRVERDHLGAGVPFATLEVGDVFGEMSFLEGAGASASVVADGAVELDVIDGTHVRTILEAIPGFAARFYQSLAVVLSERLRRTSHLALPPMCWG